MLHCGRRNPGLWGFGPVLRRFGNDLGFVSLVIYGCVVLYAATLVVSLAIGEGIMGGSLFGMLGPGQQHDVRLRRQRRHAGVLLPPLVDVLSAGWLHAGALHILFNVMWIRQLGPAVAEMFGAARMIIIYTIAGACGFLLSSFAGTYLPHLPFLSGGRSRSARPRRSSACSARWCTTAAAAAAAWCVRQAWGYAITLFVFGLIMPGVDNFAHAGARSPAPATARSLRSWTGSVGS